MAQRFSRKTHESLPQSLKIFSEKSENVITFISHRFIGSVVEANTSVSNRTITVLNFPTLHDVGIFNLYE